MHGCPGLDGEADPAVPLDDGAGGESVRPLAAHLVQAEAFARVLVVKHVHELAGVKMGAARAIVVDARAVRHQGARFQVALRCAVKSENVHDHGRDHVPDGGAAGTLMTVRSVRMSRTPTAPVGLGRAAWMEPK